MSEDYNAVVLLRRVLERRTKRCRGIVAQFRQKPSQGGLVLEEGGVGAAVGLSRFRGPPRANQIEDALSGSMLQRDPALCWKYIREIGNAVRGAEPNGAHRVMAEAERHFDRVWVLTQNVDGLHRAAGSQSIIEIHGNTEKLICTCCPWQGRAGDWQQIEIPPSCPECEALIRPDVVLFGEMLPEASLETLDRELSRGFDLTFSVGTTSVFPYIQMPVLIAARSGLPTVEINPETTPVSDVVEHRLTIGAERALEEIWTRFLGAEGE